MRSRIGNQGSEIGREQELDHLEGEAGGASAETLQEWTGSFLIGKNLTVFLKHRGTLDRRVRDLAQQS
jgi:hypothetical protein